MPECNSAVQRRTGVITDNDPLTANVRVPGLVREGSDAVFKVSLAGGMGSRPVVVTYKLDGTATPGADYTGSDGTRTIEPENANQEDRTITIPTVADQEVGETLVVRLTGVSSDAGVVSLGTQEARTTFTAQNTVIISVDDASSVQEAANATAIFVVKLDLREGDMLAAPVMLRYETGPITASSADYTSLSDTLNIPAGSTEVSEPISVTIENDDFAENDETFRLSLSLVDPPDGVVLTTDTAMATITDDDALTVNVSTTYRDMNEGSHAVFEVELADGKTGTADVHVDYTVTGYEDPNDPDDDLAEQDDYTPKSGTVTIPADSRTATIEISAVADDVLEKTETVQLTLKDPETSRGQVSLGTSSATINIPDRGTVTVSVDGPRGTVTEGREAVFTVELSGKVSEPVMVNYEVTGAATGAASPLTIKAGETTGRITLRGDGQPR